MYYHEENESTFYTIFKIGLIAAAGIMIGFLLSRIFIVSYITTGDFMEPTVKQNSRVIVLKHVAPRKGDIVLIKSPVEDGGVLLSRVIAGNGDTVEIRNKTTYINTRMIPRKWKTRKTDPRILPMSFTRRDNMPPVKVKRKELFVMGDNFDTGFDSRHFGVLPAEMVIGRVIHVMQR